MGYDISKAHQAGEKVSSSELFELLKPRWEARGPRFFVPDSKKAPKGAPMASRLFLILTHPEPIYVHKVAWGMSKKAWPNTELVRCTCRTFVEKNGEVEVDESGECAYCSCLGKSFWGYFIRALILDRVKTDEGVSVASGVSSFVLTQKMTKDALLAMSLTLQDQEEDVTNLAGRVVKAFRGTGDKSSAFGSQWNPVAYWPLTAGGAGIKKLREKGFSTELLKSIFATIKNSSVNDCYPLEDRETQLQMIKYHIMTGMRNPTVDNIEWEANDDTAAIVVSVEALLAAKSKRRKSSDGDVGLDGADGTDTAAADDDDVIGIDDLEAEKAGSSFDDDDDDDDSEDWGAGVEEKAAPKEEPKASPKKKGKPTKKDESTTSKAADVPDDDDNDVGL